MKRYLFWWLMIASLLFACDKEEVTLSLADYGVVVDDPNFDNGPALMELLSDLYIAVDEGQRVTILLPEGDIHIYSEYLEAHALYISNHDHHDLRKVALMLDGLQNVSIVGNDTHFQIHGKMIPVVVNHCKNISLKGFTIDYPHPTMTQIEVKEIDKEAGSVLVQLLAETQYEIRGHQLTVLSESDTIPVTLALPFGADGHMKWGRSDPSFNPQGIEEVEPHLLRLAEWSEFEHLQLGDVYALRSPYRPTPGIVISDSESIEISDVKVHFADGMGLLAQNSTDITLDAFQVCLAEGSPRRFTTIADATHFSGCRGVIRSTGGLYENMADDAINVHGTYLRVDSIVGGTDLYASFVHHQTFGINWYAKGDTLSLISRETLLPVEAIVPDKVEVVSPKQLRIKLATPIQVTNRSLAVENLSAYPSVRFADNVIRNNRARGALFSTRHRVECRDNLFDHTHGSAILLTGDANGWFESGPCEEVLIEGNTFVNALTARYQFTEGIISIDPQIRQLVEGQYYHGRVVIQGNHFNNYPAPLLHAVSVRELLFEGNSITINTDYPQLFEDTTAQYMHIGKFVADIKSRDLELIR